MCSDQKMLKIAQLFLKNKNSSDEDDGVLF